MRRSGMRLRQAPVAQFAASGLVATVLIGLVAVAVMRRVGTSEAVRDAKQVARLAGEGIVAPHLTPGVLAGDPQALRELDRVVRSRVLRDGVVRVKLWTGDGRIVYSDEPRLVGARYRVDAAERAALASGKVEAEVSDLSRPENRFERSQRELLEVYLPIQGPRGERLRFEVYQQFSSISASGRRLWLAFAPALLGGLLLLQLANLPLARSMVRRLRDGQAQRETLLRRAIDASDLERRRIAADLHDGVVQDLVGVSYELAAQADRAEVSADPAAALVLRRGAARARDSVRALRALLPEIYPPSLHRAGLGATLDDLATTLTARGIPTTVHVGHDLHVSEPAERLLFRSAQESLRNAAKHSGASAIEVRVEMEGDHAVLDVSDDGRGFDPAVMEQRPAEGHFGLRLLRDLVGDAGGELTVQTAPGAGTRVRVELPPA
jgi:two-component system NarL family sensor kinase